MKFELGNSIRIFPNTKSNIYVYAIIFRCFQPSSSGVWDRDSFATRRTTKPYTASGGFHVWLLLLVLFFHGTTIPSQATIALRYFSSSIFEPASSLIRLAWIFRLFVSVSSSILAYFFFAFVLLLHAYRSQLCLVFKAPGIKIFHEKPKQNLNKLLNFDLMSHCLFDFIASVFVFVFVCLAFVAHASAVVRLFVCLLSLCVCACARVIFFYHFAAHTQDLTKPLPRFISIVLCECLDPIEWQRL